MGCTLLPHSVPFSACSISHSVFVFARTACIRVYEIIRVFIIISVCWSGCLVSRAVLRCSRRTRSVWICRCVECGYTQHIHTFVYAHTLTQNQVVCHHLVRVLSSRFFFLSTLLSYSHSLASFLFIPIVVFPRPYLLVLRVDSRVQCDCVKTYF